MGQAGTMTPSDRSPFGSIRIGRIRSTDEILGALPQQ
jgi:hypothetical protein